MSGQSVVHTGSRNVSSTTLPRRLARETCRPSWLVSVKFGGRRVELAAGAGERLRDDRVGGPVDGGEGHRRRPDQDHAKRPGPGDDPHRRPGERPQQHGHPRGAADATARTARRPAGTSDGAWTSPSVPPRLRLSGQCPAPGAGSVLGFRRAVRSPRGPSRSRAPAPRYPAVNSRMNGIIEFGSVPRPPKKPRSSMSTQSARQNTAPAMTAILASRASRADGRDGQARADEGEREDRDQVDREPVRGGEVAEPGDDRFERVRLRGARHGLDHGGQRRSAARQACPARSRVPARPGAAPCRGRTRPSRRAGGGRASVGYPRPAREARGAPRPPRR